MIRKQKIKDSNQVKVTFVLPEDHPLGNASVVGDFNNWDPAANPVEKRSNKTHIASVTLEAGQRYCFPYVTGDGDWFNDEAADSYEPSGFGSDNCVLFT